MAVALTTPDSELDALRRRLTERLRTLRDQVRSRLWLDLASRLVVSVVAIGIVSFVLDWWLELSFFARIIYMVLAAGLVTWTAVKTARAVIHLRLEPIELAAELDKARGSAPGQWIAPRVATVLQLSNPQSRDAGFSAAMAERAVRNSSKAIETVDFSRHLDERHLRQCLILLAAAIATPMIFAASLPRELSSLWARRW